MLDLHLMLLGGEEVGEERARENLLSWLKDHPFLAGRLVNHLWSVSAGSSRRWLETARAASSLLEGSHFPHCSGGPFPASLPPVPPVS